MCFNGITVAEKKAKISWMCFNGITIAEKKAKISCASVTLNQWITDLAQFSAYTKCSPERNLLMDGAIWWQIIFWLVKETATKEGILICQLLSFSQVTMLKLNQLFAPGLIFTTNKWCSSLWQLLDHIYLGYCLLKHVHSKTIFFS